MPLDAKYYDQELCKYEYADAGKCTTLHITPFGYLRMETSIASRVALVNW
jgi:hypothetical protein